MTRQKDDRLRLIIAKTNTIKLEILETIKPHVDKLNTNDDKVAYALAMMAIAKCLINGFPNPLRKMLLSIHDNDQTIV